MNDHENGFRDDDGYASPFADDPVERSGELLQRLIRESSETVAREAAEARRQAKEDRHKVKVGTYRYLVNYAAGLETGPYYWLPEIAELKREANVRMVIAAVKAGLGKHDLAPDDAAKRIVHRLVRATKRTQADILSLSVDEAITLLDENAHVETKPKKREGRKKGDWIALAKTLYSEDPTMKDSMIADHPDIAVDKSAVSRCREYQEHKMQVDEALRAARQKPKRNA